MPVKTSSAEAKPSPRDVIVSMKKTFVQLPRYGRVMEQLEELLLQGDALDDPDHLFIIGESGVGKSRILKRFKSSHPRVVHTEFTEIPVLYLCIPSKSSIDDIASAALLEMGSAFWNCGKTKELTFQLKKLLKACKVQMILIDEMNHLVDKGLFKTHHLIADWLKLLSDDIHIPIVFAGIPRATLLLYTNDQLRGRFREVVEIAPFSVETKSGLLEFRNVLKSYETMASAYVKIDFSSVKMARRMIFATAGRMREIRRLIFRVVKLACKTNPPRASMATFSEAFRQVIYPGAPDTRDPFTSKFEKIPLTRPGEPYAPRAGE